MNETLTIQGYTQLTPEQLAEIGTLVQQIRATGVDPRISLEWLASRDGIRISDWLAYLDQHLVGVASTSVFGGTLEATLAVAPLAPPDTANRLFMALLAEIPSRTITRVLLLHDRNATALRQLAEQLKLTHDHAELVMCRAAAYGEVTVFPGPLSVRIPSEAELPLLAQVHAESWGGNASEILSSIRQNSGSSTVNYYLATLGEEPVAALNIQWLEGRPWVYGFSVSPDYRGQGYGRQTLTFALADAIRRSPGEAYLECEPNNTVAVKLYQSLGFAALRTFDYWAKELANGTNT